VRISPGIGGLLPSPGGGGAGAEAGSGPVEIGVIGSRWGWTFSYGQAGIVVTGTGIPGPEAVVPADEPVRFVVTATDVIHSFYVPQFLAKYDAVPGRSYTFEATIRPGTYGGQCAEYCGLLHAEMPFSVHAVPRAEYQAWLLQQPRVP
jgi:cytochrome c oxidase subunit 2